MQLIWQVCMRGVQVMGSDGGMSADLMMQLIQETRANRAAIAELASHPINNNYFDLKRTTDHINEIQTVTGL